VGGGGDKLANRHRGRVNPGGDEAGDVGDVGHDGGAGAVSYFPKHLKINGAGVGAGPHDDQFGAMFLCLVFHLVEVDGFGVPGDAVGHHVIQPTGKVGGAAVGEVTAVRQVHTENRVSGLKDGEIDPHVGLGSRMGLDVHMVGAEKPFAALDGQGLHDIHIFAAAVVALGRVSFGILVGHDGSLRGEDRFAHKVFRGDHL